MKYTPFGEMQTPRRSEMGITGSVTKPIFSQYYTIHTFFIHIFPRVIDLKDGTSNESSEDSGVDTARLVHVETIFFY